MLLAVAVLSLLSAFVGRVSAQANGDIRLVGPFGSNSRGRLEIYINLQWGTVCDDGFRLDEANVVCRQLGYASASDYGTASDLDFSSGSGVIWLDQVECSSSYLHILQCSYNNLGDHDCSHSEDVAVECSSSRLDDSPYTGQIRLVGGAYPSQGRLEVYCSDEWGTVCDDFFDFNDAETICRQLGYNDYDSYDSFSFPSGSSNQEILMDDLFCTSSDDCILECGSCPTTHNCVHSEDVNVYCSYNTLSTSTSNELGTCSSGGSSDAGTIVGIVLGALAGVVILVCILACCITCCVVQSSKKRTPRQQVVQNVQMSSNITTAQAPPSSYPPPTYPQQPPPANPQTAYPVSYPAQHPAQAAYPAQVPYPAQAAYPGQVPYPTQAPYPVQGQAPYSNQPQSTAYPTQASAPYPVATGEETATAPPPPTNPEFQMPPPPSYSEAQQQLNFQS